MNLVFHSSTNVYMIYSLQMVNQFNLGVVLFSELTIIPRQRNKGIKIHIG